MGVLAGPFQISDSTVKRTVSTLWPESQRNHVCTRLRLTNAIQRNHMKLIDPMWPSFKTFFSDFLTFYLNIWSFFRRISFRHSISLFYLAILVRPVGPKKIATLRWGSGPASHRGSCACDHVRFRLALAYIYIDRHSADSGWSGKHLVIVLGAR